MARRRCRAPAMISGGVTAPDDEDVVAASPDEDGQDPSSAFAHRTITYAEDHLDRRAAEMTRCPQ